VKRAVGLLFVAAIGSVSAQAPVTLPIRGLTDAPSVAFAYDTILDADFANLPARLTTTCAAAQPEVCRTLEAVAVWWEIALEPESRMRDPKFSRVVDEAIVATQAWTTREPARAEAWFYLGAAYGARVQWRVLRQERLAAARDGKAIKNALERALVLDPNLHDANFGIGMYRYYADVAPGAIRMLRWLFLLPGGDRNGGLRQIHTARERGQVVRGEAEYQLHLIYLWYERRFKDALELVRGLQARYPHNPLFHQLEAEIHSAYFHDAAASLAASSRLLDLARRGRVHEPELASVRARLNMAIELERLGDRTRAIDLLNEVIVERPARPYGAMLNAQRLLERLQKPHHD
jgi:hypothetical protein